MLLKNCWMLTALLAALAAAAHAAEPKEEPKMPEPKLELATFGQGCFWCAEAIFVRIDGVSKSVSGYMGGKIENPTYKQICNGDTGHAEVIQVTYDPAKVSFDKLLDVFFTSHDPTTLNRQGNDVGTQYRSVVFYHSEEQKKQAEAAKAKWNQSGKFRNPIVTEISPAQTFYKAEDYHQEYFKLNPNKPYCRAIIAPKVEKLEKELGKK
ncbi:MAG: peptide-methionine (S)-S-oxide reductase MsrA [Planctomycetes bacterium]|nr:peptide-methionine (S)-S-oxide reductase MsrA [Planctomycetota bacterium]